MEIIALVGLVGAGFAARTFYKMIWTGHTVTQELLSSILAELKKRDK